MSKRASSPPIYTRIREILELAKTSLARTVNTTQVVANWLIGREIVEDEQRGKRRAAYGKQVLQDLSKQLQAEFGRGYSVNNLENFRAFYLNYPFLIESTISHALRGESGKPEKNNDITEVEWKPIKNNWTARELERG